MRLMPGRIEVAQPEREVDRVDVFERRSEQRQVRRKVGGGNDECELSAGRRRTPSFRLPILYPCRSIVTCW